jgi:hypothetical protein
MSKLASLNLIDLFVDVYVKAVEKLSVGKKNGCGCSHQY